MHKLLIVDDEWMIREGLKKTVPWGDWHIEVAGTAKNGSEALGFLQELSVDILLTDIRMPKMNGLELIERCKQQFPAMKIVLLSGHDEFSYAQKALRLGVSDFLLKPTDFNELKRVMLTISQELKMEQHTHDSGLPSLLKSIMANPSSGRMDELKQQHNFPGAYGVVLLQGAEKHSSDLDTGKYILIENKQNEHIYFYYQMEDRSEWEQLLALKIEGLRKNGFTGVMKASSCSEEIEQLYTLYLQSATASLAVYQDENLQVFRYGDEKRNPVILNTIQYVSENLDKPLNQSEFAKALHMSNGNFSKVFKQYTGMNFVDFITEKRIHKAKELLTYTNLKTSEIAEQTGYPEARYFNQLFKKKVGCSPKEFREQPHLQSSVEKF